mmetsp:Transcript_1792/g.6239  ORF Transcript_1792/g.6239 Transcript_1792/m.6239 type:complete len:507 (+) Transcript_1792:246-1766(+)
MGSLDPVWVAQSNLKRGNYDKCIEVCTGMLDKNPYDKAVWYLKCRALTLKNWIDDMEMEEEGVADLLLDENATAQMARPGTSLSRPLTQATGGGAPNQGVRPMSSSGRPLTGFARPGTSSRPGTGTKDVAGAMQGNRPGTSRPVTSGGRFVRLGTASMLAEPGGPFVNVEKLDLRKYAARPYLARVLCDYITYHDHNPKKAQELAAIATVQADYADWWWKARLGKAYYQLGLFRDAEKQFSSSLRDQEMVATSLELCKVYIRLDQPNDALKAYHKAAESMVGDTSILLGAARIYDAVNDMQKSVQLYKRVLYYDASNVEAIACLAAHHFYTDQPEIALRFFRRLLQMGVYNSELWNNIGLCCFYASQYDMTLTCFERALAISGDDNMADIWYNIGQVAIGIGDLGLAYQSFKIAVSVDSSHAESFNNLGVLELRKGNVEQARSNFQVAAGMAGHMFEPFFNGALLAFKLGDFQESHELCQKALAAFPDHTDSHELLKQLKQHFTSL